MAEDKKYIYMSQGMLQGRENESSKKKREKNMSMTLSNVKDTINIEVFLLKILWKIILNQRIKIDLVIVRLKKKIATNHDHS